jgi:hypothetical protein
VFTAINTYGGANMRINEIANAEEQLALWKIVSDNTWAAVSQQAEAERKQRAEQAAQRKLKPKIGGKRGGRKSLPPPPQITPPPPPLPSIKKPPTTQQKAEVGRQATQKLGGGMKQQQANNDNPQQPNTLPTQQKVLGMAQQQTDISTPHIAQMQQLQATQQPLTPLQMRLQRQNVGNLTKGSAATK